MSHSIHTELEPIVTAGQFKEAAGPARPDPKVIKEQQALVNEYHATAKLYNNLVLKGSIASSGAAKAAIVKRITPVAAKLEQITATIKQKYPHLLKK